MLRPDEDQVSYSSPVADQVLKAAEESHHYLTVDEVRQKIKECADEMRSAAKELRFEAAAQWRDQMQQYQQIELTLA